MKRLLSSLLPLLLLSCTTPEPKGECVDWRPYEVEESKCTALYGNLICIDQKVTRYQCVLRLPPEESEG